MIISQLLGGLGNQMFQYAAARSLALNKEAELRLDSADFLDYRLHKFELTRVFNCSHKEATSEDFKRVLGWRGRHRVRKLLQSPCLSFVRGESLVVEPHFQYWDDFEKLGKDTYLLGYWQSERYFRSIETALREDFSFKVPLSGENMALSEQMTNCHSVSLHIRRGDYVLNQKTNQVHGTCSLDYYHSALLYISERVESPVFFLFSDDPDWVRENFMIPYPCVYVDHNSGDSSYKDMQLMSLCRHNIIANSSFSWWGAWLNANQNKIVVAPKQWFGIDRDTKDLIPEGWARLSC